MRQTQCLKRGDTIIEVLFAITIFSLVVVSSLAIMNKGVAASQRALEITLVRQQIDGQAEALRFLNSSYVAAYDPSITVGPTYASGPGGIVNRYTTDSPADKWSMMVKDIISYNLLSVPKFSNIVSEAGCSSSAPAKSFAINTKTAKHESLSTANFKLASSFSQLRYKASDPSIVDSYDGIWIQAVRADTSPKYIDFHIRACWSSIGQTAPVTIGTIVRLYEPK